MRQIEYVVRAAKGDRIVKIFEDLVTLEAWLEKREAETQYVPLRITKRIVEEISLFPLALAKAA